MSLKDSFSFWKDVFIGKYKHLKFRDFFAIYVRSIPTWNSCSKECDDIFEKIIQNYNEIKCIDYCKSHNELRIKYEDGRYIKIPIASCISFFLENVSLFDGSGNLICSLWGYHPRRRLMIKFLDKFHDFICIRNGKVVVTDPNTKENVKKFFDFDRQGEKNEPKG